MVDDVKPPRTYDSRKRQAAAQETRAAILDAARALFLDHGYGATSMATIATVAGVHVDTIYATIGRKPDLLRLLLEAAISGENAEVPALQRRYVQEVRAESDPHRKLARYARAVREVQPRLAPIVRVVQEAAATEPALGILWSEISERRARNMRMLVDELAATTPLRDGLTRDEAADIIWASNGPELYTLLVGQRGWSPDRFETFLTDLWTRLLLPDDPRSP